MNEEVQTIEFAVRRAVRLADGQAVGHAGRVPVLKLVCCKEKLLQIEFQSNVSMHRRCCLIHGHSAGRTLRFMTTTITCAHCPSKSRGWAYVAPTLFPLHLRVRGTRKRKNGTEGAFLSRADGYRAEL